MNERLEDAKKAMMTIAANRTLTDGFLSTTMCLVESTLNSIPLISVRDDPENLDDSTQNNFLPVRTATSSKLDAERIQICEE